MIPQSIFTITANIASGKEEGLRELLTSMNQAPGVADPRNTLLPFYQFGRLHGARFVIIEANTNDDLRAYGVEPGQWPPTLGFIGDIDGASDIFLAELAVRAGAGLRRIFAHCEGFDAEQTDLLAWMKRHNRRAIANYVNWRGRTVVQIREEFALGKALREQVLQVTKEEGSSDPRFVHRRLGEFVDKEIAAGRLSLSPPEPTPPGWFIGNIAHLIALPLVLMALTPFIVIGAPFFLIRLRMLERSAPENLLRPSREHVRNMAMQEDFDVTNQFNVFGQIKPGRFRLYTIRSLLILVDYAVRHIYKRGFLTRIQSIHFARWVLMDDNKRAFFATTYDGSVDSYMDDFINKVAWGLNLIFSNGVGYPKSRWLIKGGADYEEKYKRTIRRAQLPSASWYNAHPGLSAVDMARNGSIRKGLELANPSTSELRDWLRLL